MKLALVVAAALALTGCLKRPPPHPRALECNELCTMYVAQGELAKAEVQCDLGLQFSPEYADLWVNKGLIALKRENTEKAKEHFIRAVRYNQEQAQAYNNLGYIYLGAREYGKAHDNFQRALRVNPDYLEARYNLALTFKGMNQPAKAKKELLTIVEINPTLADPHAQLGQLALDEGELGQALEELDKAVKLSPDFIEAWLLIGNVYMEQSKPCDAKEAFSSCLEVDQNQVQCRNNIVLAEKKCQLQDKAMKDVNERLAGDRSAASEYARAQQAREKGLVGDEERYLKRCLRYDPKFPQCHWALFNLFKNRSDERQAQIACKNFIKFATGPEYEAQVAECQRIVGE